MELKPDCHRTRRQLSLPEMRAERLDAMTAEQLEALSKAATQGLLKPTAGTGAHVTPSEPSVFVACMGRSQEKRDASTAFLIGLWNAYRTGQLVMVDDAAVERVAKRKFPSRWAWPPSASENDVHAKIDSICGCAGQYDCDCISVFNRACSEMWFDHNTAIAAMGGK